MDEGKASSPVSGMKPVRPGMRYGDGAGGELIADAEVGRCGREDRTCYSREQGTDISSETKEYKNTSMCDPRNSEPVDQLQAAISSPLESFAAMQSLQRKFTDRSTSCIDPQSQPYQNDSDDGHPIPNPTPRFEHP